MDAVCERVRRVAVSNDHDTDDHCVPDVDTFLMISTNIDIIMSEASKSASAAAGDGDPPTGEPINPPLMTSALQQGPAEHWPVVEVSCHSLLKYVV